MFIFSGCKTLKKTTMYCVFIDEGNIAFYEMIELIGTSPIDSNKVKSVKIYSYEFKKNGRIKDSTLIDHSDLKNINIHDVNLHTTYKIKYDSLGREFERYATRVSSGKSHLNYRKEYDKNSNLKKWTVFNPDGKINFETLYFYNDSNQLIKSEKYQGHFIYDNFRLQTLKEYEYRDTTLIKEIEWSNYSDSTGFNSKLIQKYDIEGKLINYKSEILENAKIISYWGFKKFYNSNKKVIVEKRYGSDNKIVTTTYKYNSMGLPVESLSINQHTKKTTRQIKYFYYKERRKTTTHNKAQNVNSR